MDTHQKASSPDEEFVQAEVVPPPARMEENAGLRMLVPVGRSGWAIAAGYLGLFAFLILPAPVALIVSVIAIRDIQQSRGSQYPKYGMGRAIFGLIVGLFGSLALLVAVAGSLAGM